MLASAECVVDTLQTFGGIVDAPWVDGLRTTELDKNRKKEGSNGCVGVHFALFSGDWVCRTNLRIELVQAWNDGNPRNGKNQLHGAG
jgi:hypothetical protein